MTLADIVNQLSGAAGDQIICVRRPWSAQAESILAQLDENLSVPSDVKAAGFDYFLEVFLARELLETFSSKCATFDDKIQLLVFYAENDAYPEWALL